MSNRWLQTRQTKYAAYLAVYVIVVLAVVSVTNVLADRYNKSYDSTANKRYSLSDQTAKIVKGLKQDATITYFDQAIHYDRGKDLLSRYANLQQPPSIFISLRHKQINICQYPGQPAAQAPISRKGAVGNAGIYHRNPRPGFFRQTKKVGPEFGFCNHN